MNRILLLLSVFAVMSCGTKSTTTEDNTKSNTVALNDLFSAKDSYSGKTIKVKGNVVKVNNGIMGKNWVHIQENPDDPNAHDLTITTQDQAEVGTTATFEGVITTNKDFGSGYSYEIIMEEAKKLP